MVFMLISPVYSRNSSSLRRNQWRSHQDQHAKWQQSTPRYLTVSGQSFPGGPHHKTLAQDLEVKRQGQPQKADRQQVSGAGRANPPGEREGNDQDDCDGQECPS